MLQKINDKIIEQHSILDYVEEYRPIKDFEDYSVSNLGNVISYKTNEKGVQLSKQDNLNGYKFVHIYSRGKRYKFYIHRLVFATFVAEISHKFEINHKDSNRSNNCFYNLEQITSSGNTIHSILTTENWNAIPVIITDIHTNNSTHFYSFSSASLFMGKKRNYISSSIIRNKYSNKDYFWKVVDNSAK